MDDYYELLDVAPDSDRDDIRTAYRSKRDALQSQDGDQTRARVAELNRAWNVLSDPAQRERYDERLAEHRESGDDGDDGDERDDGEPRARSRTRATPSAAPGSKAEQRAEARRARMERRPTITVPDGHTMAQVRRRLQALGFDVLVLLFLAFGIYLLGIKYIDNKFPGERNQRTEFVTQEKQIVKQVDTDKKNGSSKDPATAAKGRAAQKTDQKQLDTLQAKISKIDKKLTPTYLLVVAFGFVILLLYLVPSSVVSGQTLGKKQQRIKVIHVDGSRLGWYGAALRFGVPLLVGLLLGVKFLGPLGPAVAVMGTLGWVSKPNRQGLHDKLAKTIVVDA